MPKTLDHLGRFDLKFVRNCPTARGKIFVHFDKEDYTKPKKPELYVLHYKSSYDIMLFMFQSHQQHFDSLVKDAQ
jgi:hypothetical protein